MSHAAQPVHSFPVSVKGVVVRDGRVLFFARSEVADLTMPAGYRRSIDSWFTRLAESAAGRR